MNQELKNIQKSLYNLGYNAESNIDGLFGRKTEKAVRNAIRNDFEPVGTAIELPNNILYQNLQHAEKGEYTLFIAGMEFYKISGNTLITKHFTISEWAGNQYPNNQQTELHLNADIVNLYEQFRRYLNKPIIITAGYRSPEVNERVGGMPTSLHLMDKDGAGDSYCPKISISEYRDKAIEFGKFNTIGYYEDLGFLHLDNNRNNKLNTTY